jgi:phage gp36-like protein
LAGTYITAASVLYPFVEAAVIDELIDDDGDGNVDTTVFDGMVSLVEAQFESYICRRYDIPLDVTDSTILAIAQFYCGRLFEYHVYARRRAVDDEMGSRYNQTLQELEAIRNGRIGLRDTAPVESPATTTYTSAESTDRSFSPSGMAAWGGGSDRED